MAIDTKENETRTIVLSLQEYTDILRALYTYRQALVDIMRGVQSLSDISAHALKEVKNDQIYNHYR